VTEAASKCDLCGRAIVEGVPWIMLNRWAIGTGKNRRMSELEGDDGPSWDIEKEVGDGRILCQSPCLLTWLEGVCIDVDHQCRKESE